MEIKYVAALLCVIAVLVLTGGCNEQNRKEAAALVGAIRAGIEMARQSTDERTWHERYNWVAENYFDDPQIIEFARAIEREDIATIDRLIAEGVDVNAVGRDSMTLLFWAFYVDNLDVFARILEAGADPNVQFESDFGTGFDRWTGSPLATGNTIVHMAASEGPAERLRLLIDAGADPNHVGRDGRVPLIRAVDVGAYDQAIILIEAGADWLVAIAGGRGTLAPIVPTLAHQDSHSPSYLRLVEILEEKGADFDLQRELVRFSKIDTGRMDRNEAISVREEHTRLLLQRHELYERLLQERMQE